MTPTDAEMRDGQLGRQRAHQPAKGLGATADDGPDSMLQQATGHLGAIEGVSGLHKVAAHV